ncbi:hypothetical protein GGD88_002903 [Roseospira goensis]|uniref:Uncharacterized protein n=1 Tax=Roseospira goensis TaxID=391922 RepID=A0A7W6WLS0_9PROT|nr:hypothetical protein [Roseospira goensis]
MTVATWLWRSVRLRPDAPALLNTLEEDPSP